ncbi:MAG: hypothetical protein DRI57_18235 [Deltaproteobacteria bacterium]|nr:MAG: hypothetical protein DRI57_18235 [Deltaproteobacteria bacterium]
MITFLSRLARYVNLAGNRTLLYDIFTNQNAKPYTEFHRKNQRDRWEAPFPHSFMLCNPEFFSLVVSAGYENLQLQGVTFTFNFSLPSKEMRFWKTIHFLLSTGQKFSGIFSRENSFHKPRMNAGESAADRHLRSSHANTWKYIARYL